jgi:hypothetical protein
VAWTGAESLLVLSCPGHWWACRRLRHLEKCRAEDAGVRAGLEWAGSHRATEGRAGNRERWRDRSEPPTERLAHRSRHAACSPFSLCPWGSDPCGPPKNGAHRLAVDHSSRKIHPPRSAQHIEKAMVYGGPDSQGGPIAQSAPTGHSAAASHLLGQHVPRNSSTQDEDDAHQGISVRHRRSSAFRSGRRRWQEGLDLFPEFVRDQDEGHGFPSLWPPTIQISSFAGTSFRVLKQLLSSTIALFRGVAGGQIG